MLNSAIRSVTVSNISQQKDSFVTWQWQLIILSGQCQWLKTENCLPALSTGMLYLVTVWSYLGKDEEKKKENWTKRCKWLRGGYSVIFKCDQKKFHWQLSSHRWITVWAMRGSQDTYFSTIIWIWCWTSARMLAVMLFAIWSLELWKLSIICWSWPIMGSRVSCSLCFLFFIWVSSCWMSVKMKRK